MTDEPEPHPSLAPLSFLLGRWEGAGVVGYPTIESAQFGQEITFGQNGKPYLIYSSRTWLLDEYHQRVHSETRQTPHARWTAGGWLPRLPVPGVLGPNGEAAAVSAIFPSTGIAHLAAYLSYFALTFFALRWWKMADPKRSSR